MRILSLKSYAKINIALSITESREDGYHELDSVMIPVELHDTIILSKLRKAVDNYVTVDDYTLTAFNHNLATYAIDKLSELYKFEQKFRIFIHKNIPIQAGLGGGSSNAAFTMKAVNQMLKLGIDNDKLKSIGKTLGADVPFFIDCVPCRVTGIGENITPITIKNNYYVLLVKPKQGCSTKETYSKFQQKNHKNINIENVIKALEEGDDELLANSIGNDLEDPAIESVPEIQVIKDYLKSKGLKIVMMSGSGSTVFAMSQDKKLLKTIEEELEDKYFVELTKVLK